MRSEGFSFNSAGVCSRLVVSVFAAVVNRPPPTATVRRWSAMALTLCEAFGEGFGWKHNDSCEIARKQVET